MKLGAIFMIHKQRNNHTGTAHSEFISEEISLNQLFRSQQWKLLHDNTPVYKATFVMDYTAKRSVTVLSYPPYSPDISPCDFFYIPKLKLTLKGKRFSSSKEVIENTTTEINKLRKIDYETALNCFLTAGKNIFTTGRSIDGAPVFRAAQKPITAYRSRSECLVATEFTVRRLYCVTMFLAVVLASVVVATVRAGHMEISCDESTASGKFRAKFCEMDHSQDYFQDCMDGLPQLYMDRLETCKTGVAPSTDQFVDIMCEDCDRFIQYANCIMDIKRDIH
ncbi:hypothetical protein LAZ67_20000041, partial [Cordylochernes scorpioides]